MRANNNQNMGTMFNSKRPHPTRKRVLEVLSYNAKTGVFTRKVQTSVRINVGDIAGLPILRLCRNKFLLEHMTPQKKRPACGIESA